jgi:hypothetical protein
LHLEQLEDRCLLSNFSLGALVQAGPTDPFAGCGIGNQTGIYFPGTQVESPLAVDPTNPNHMVGVWQQERWHNGGSFGTVASVSFDAGLHWTEVVIPGLTTCSGGTFDRASDPWVSFGPTGVLYASNLVVNVDANAVLNADAAIKQSGVAVSKSTDGGLTWSQPTLVILTDTQSSNLFNDKDSITADPHNPNLVYTVWDQLNQQSLGATETLLSRSTNGGQTWGTPQVIFQSPTNGHNIGHQILVLPNGTLVDAFDEIQLDATHFPIAFSGDFIRSTDHGVTWSAPIVAAEEMPTAFGVLDPLNGIGVRIIDGLPLAAVDPVSGNLYAVWQDARFSPVNPATGTGEFDSIVFSMSSDGGFTWSSPIQINQTPTNLANFGKLSQAFTPSIAVGASGTVAVTYNDFRFQGTIPGAATDRWVVFGSPKGSGGLSNPANWGNELRLTSSSFNILNAPFAFGWMLGEYEGLAAAGKNFEAFFPVAGSTFPQASVFARQILDPPTAPSGVREQQSGVSRGTVAVSSLAPGPWPLTPAGGEFSAALQASSVAAASGFLAPVSYATDKAPFDVAVGDFNNDGIPDLVTANFSSSDVSLLLGNGDGTFQAQKTFAVGLHPRRLAVGDFDGDGTLDIVTANQNDLTILFGKGDGTFKSPVTLTLPNVIANQEAQSPLSVAVADLNHDGKFDLLVTAADSLFSVKGYVNVFLGNGDGTFKALPPMALNSAAPVSLALADLNHDGNLDAVTTNSDGSNVSVLLGKGDGTFVETSDPVVNSVRGSDALALGNFNGFPDVVEAGSTFVGGNTQGFVFVCLGNGDGTFQPFQTISLGSTPPGAVAVGDFNGDGKLDIVTANFGTVSVLLGNGNGTFQAPLSFSGTFGRLAVGDFNRDGFPDLAVTDGSANSIVVLINSGTWPALATTATVATGSAPQPASTAAPAPSDSAPSQPSPYPLAGGEGLGVRGVPFGADPAAADQLFASSAAGDRMALLLGMQPPALDSWGDPRLSDAFVDLLSASHLARPRSARISR